MGLCSDSPSYYRLFGSCLDFILIPCEEKKQVQFWCIQTVFPPIRIEWGWALGAPRPASA